MNSSAQKAAMKNAQTDIVRWPQPAIITQRD
jgi:hypothetical protein